MVKRVLTAVVLIVVGGPAVLLWLTRMAFDIESRQITEDKARRRQAIGRMVAHEAVAPSQSVTVRGAKWREVDEPEGEKRIGRIGYSLRLANNTGQTLKCGVNVVFFQNELPIDKDYATFTLPPGDSTVTEVAYCRNSDKVTDIQVMVDD